MQAIRQLPDLEQKDVKGVIILYEFRYTNLYPMFRIAHRVLARIFILPFPIPNFWHVFAVLRDILLVLDQFVPDCLLGVGRRRTKLAHTINDVPNEVKTVEIIHNHHIEWR